MSSQCHVTVDATVHERIKVSGHTILSSVTSGILIQFDTSVITVFCRLNHNIHHNLSSCKIGVKRNCTHKTYNRN